MTPLARRLQAMGACEEAYEWVDAQGFSTAQAAWEACTNPCWMAWLIARQHRQTGIRVAVELVRTACPRAERPERFVGWLDQLTAWADGDKRVDLHMVQALAEEAYYDARSGHPTERVAHAVGYLAHAAQKDNRMLRAGLVEHGVTEALMAQASEPHWPRTDPVVVLVALVRGLHPLCPVEDVHGRLPAP